MALRNRSLGFAPLAVLTALAAIAAYVGVDSSDGKEPAASAAVPSASSLPGPTAEPTRTAEPGPSATVAPPTEPSPTTRPTPTAEPSAAAAGESFDLAAALDRLAAGKGRYRNRTDVAGATVTEVSDYDLGAGAFELAKQVPTRTGDIVVVLRRTSGGAYFLKTVQDSRKPACWTRSSAAEVRRDVAAVLSQPAVPGDAPGPVLAIVNADTRKAVRHGNLVRTTVDARLGLSLLGISARTLTPVAEELKDRRIPVLLTLSATSGDADITGARIDGAAAKRALQGAHLGRLGRGLPSISSALTFSDAGRTDLRAPATCAAG